MKKKIKYSSDFKITKELEKNINEFFQGIKKRMDFYKSPTWKEIKNEELL